MTRLKGVRDHGRGSFVLDRNFRGVGRIKRASGTTDRKIFTLLNGMLTTLYVGGRLDLLRSIRDGVASPMEVWQYHRTSSLDQAPSPAAMKRLRKTVETFTTTYQGRRGEGISDRHRYELRAKLAKVGSYGPAASTLVDVPRLLRAYRADCEAAGTHRVFNYAKAACLALLRATLSRTSPLYLEVSAVEGLTEHPKQGHPQTVEQARAIREALGPSHGWTWWVMCCTGMGPDEYLEGKWKVVGDRVEILGTKRERRHRVIPRVCDLPQPRRRYKAFRDALVAATAGTIRPYDGRRTFAHWMELAGIPRSRRKAYMGQSGGDVLGRYEAHEVASYLTEDRRRLLAVLGEVERPALRLA